MSSATKDTVTVFFDPNSVGKQADVIGPATSQKAGAMTAAQAAKLAGLTPGMASTLTQTYDAGASSADQTALIDPAKGGGIIAKAKSALAGRLLAALNSVGGVVFDVIDAAIPQVLAAGMFIKNDPGFGSPVMGSQTPGNFASYTADGIGGSWGGTGMTARANGANSTLTFSINDVGLVGITEDGIQPNGYGSNPGMVLPIVANTIAPTQFLASVGAGLIKNITPPPLTLSGGTSYMLRIVPSAAFTWDATGNIAIGGTAVVGRTLDFTFDGTATWYPNYV